MSSPPVSSPLPDLLVRLIALRQLTDSDARAFLARPASSATLNEPAVLRWLAAEYRRGLF